MHGTQKIPRQPDALAVELSEVEKRHIMHDCKQEDRLSLNLQKKLCYFVAIWLWFCSVQHFFDSLISIKPDYVSRNGLSDGQECWKLPQQRLQSIEAVTVVSVMIQPNRVKLGRFWKKHDYPTMTVSVEKGTDSNDQIETFQISSQIASQRLRVERRNRLLWIFSPTVNPEFLRTVFALMAK